MKGPIKDDYLWDGSGEPDPEVRRLEAALTKFRHRGEPPAFPQLPRSEEKNAWWRIFVAPRFAIAAVVIAAVALAIVSVMALRFRRGAESAGWEVAELSGKARVGSRTIVENGKPAGLRAGESLETDSESRLTISATTFGEINIEPNTRLRLLRTAVPGRRHLSLERGTIHARIWAQPGDFAVDTPSARAIDLGCVYTLHVDDSGAGLLRTTIGWVGFKLADHESFIPAGAVCATRPKIGPGTPYFEDAPEAFRSALSAFDFEAGTPEQRAAELQVILKQARAEDALTLWHLLPRVDASERRDVYQRLAGFVAPPPGVTLDGILRLDQKMLDDWWSALGYGDISVWRTWERSWAQSKLAQGSAPERRSTER